MKKFTYYSLNDDNKESINKCEKENIEEAVIYFSSIKKLSIDHFLELFKVIES